MRIACVPKLSEQQRRSTGFTRVKLHGRERRGNRAACLGAACECPIKTCQLGPLQLANVPIAEREWQQRWREVENPMSRVARVSREDFEGDEDEGNGLDSRILELRIAPCTRSGRVSSMGNASVELRVASACAQSQ